MNKPYLFSLNRKDRVDLFGAAASRTGLPLFVLEKDYYVTLVLKILFEQFKPQHMEATPTPIMFKGGTTLSKIFGCIDRMSEDIDISLDMRFLGHPEIEGESNSARQRRVLSLNAAAQYQVETLIAPFLRRELMAIDAGFSVEVISGTADIEIFYPQIFQSNAQDYIKSRVLLECGGKAGLEPSVTFKIAPIALEGIAGHQDHCHVDALGCNRTFFEKLTALHEINHRGADALGERQSRHIYDVVAIHEAFPDYIHNRELLSLVVEHKKKYFRRATSKWDLAEPGKLWLVPEGEVATALKDDWEKMDIMFPGHLPWSFSELVAQLQIISDTINGTQP